GHDVYAVGEVLPGPRDAGNLRLASELPLRTHLPSDARDLRGERAQLIHHRIDRVFELEDLAFGFDGGFLGQVAVGDRRRHEGDVAHLIGEVSGKEVHVVGEIFPRARYALDIGLSAELPLGADLFGDARDLGGEGTQLVEGCVDGVLELED